MRTPDGRIGYVTEQGVRHAFTAPVRYPRTGRVVSFRLDGGAYQQKWGRLFIDAHQPPGTEIRVGFIASDECDGEALAWAAPANMESSALLPTAACTLPPRRLLSEPLRALLEEEKPDDLLEDLADLRRLHLRTTGIELPWAQPPREPFATYEAPVLAPLGRYLWVVIELRGATRKTPRLRRVRVEYPGHDCMERLPQLFSRDENAAGFLYRYLALPAGVLGELEARADQRHLLLNPYSVPTGLLPWLGSLLGLTMDDKWSESQQRRLISECTTIYRERGTVQGLSRLLQIYTGGPVRVVEHHRLSGGSAVVGDRRGAVVGEGLGPGQAGVSGGPNQQLAHRCLVIVLTPLSEQQQLAVERLVREHQPAHVQCELCVVPDRDASRDRASYRRQRAGGPGRRLWSPERGSCRAWSRSAARAAGPCGDASR